MFSWYCSMEMQIRPSSSRRILFPHQIKSFSSKDPNPSSREISMKLRQAASFPAKRRSSTCPTIIPTMASIFQKIQQAASKAICLQPCSRKQRSSRRYH